MVKNLYHYTSKSLNPYHNLALEELLAKDIKEAEAFLYLWQNDNTVVIGKHQNAFTECNYEKMKENSVSLARRKTGGGAVFHDKNNLNFTFINRKEDYDLNRNQNIIKRAMQQFGLECEITGRNDITLNNKKFSGNAYFSSKNYCIHHGTIMLDVDLTRLEEYLNVDPTKLLNKGVSSVRSRVINLKSVVADITIPKTQKAFILAFEEIYGLACKDYDLNRIQKDFKELIDFYSSEEFLFGNYPVILNRKRKEYGELMITKSNKQLHVFSDCLDVDIIDYINNSLKKGVNYIAIKNCFSILQKQIITDLNNMLLEVTPQCKD